MNTTTFVAPNGVKVTGVILYSSPIYHERVINHLAYDEIVYAQNRIVKIHHTLEPTDNGKYDECHNPKVEILTEYASIPSISI